MSSYAEFTESDGSVRMAGELLYPNATPSDVLTVQSDGSIAAATGGGSSSALKAVYTSSGTAIAHGESAALPFTTLAAGTALFDLTDPTNPLALATGVYIIAAQVSPGGLDSGDFYGVEVDLDTAGDFAGPQAQWRGDLIGCVTAAYVVPAGSGVDVTVFNRASANDGTFGLTAVCTFIATT